MPTQNGLPPPACQRATAMNGATAAPRIDATLYEMPEPVYRTFVGNSSGSSAPIGPNVMPMSEKPTTSHNMTPQKPAPSSGTQSRPNTMMPRVTEISVLRRPHRSAQGPESRVKIPKNTTPPMSMRTKVLYE